MVPNQFIASSDALRGNLHKPTLYIFIMLELIAIMIGIGIMDGCSKGSEKAYIPTYQVLVDGALFEVGMRKR